jgi:hypothetical protein
LNIQLGERGGDQMFLDLLEIYSAPRRERPNNKRSLLAE